jgi:hypothetical protein
MHDLMPAIEQGRQCRGGKRGGTCENDFQRDM